MLITRSPDEPSRDQGNRDVYPENEPPALIDRDRQPDDCSSPDRTEHPADGIDRAHDANGSDAPPWRKEIADQRQRDWQERATACALDRASDDQGFQRLSVRAKQGASYKYGERADDDRRSPDHVREPADDG